MTVVNQDLRMQIANRVQAALDRYQPRNYRVQVDPAGIVEDGEWYQVVVTSTNDRRDRDFYDALASAESDLNDQDPHHQYLLVPVIAD